VEADEEAYPVIPGGDAGELMRMKVGIAIAGTS